jgi:hypothetical protein
MRVPRSGLQTPSSLIVTFFGMTSSAHRSSAGALDRIARVPFSSVLRPTCGRLVHAELLRPGGTLTPYHVILLLACVLPETSITSFRDR